MPEPTTIRDRIEMTEVQVYGERFEVPKMLTDELMRLRALERQQQDEDRVRLTAAWEAQHGSLPAPPPSDWVRIDA